MSNDEYFLAAAYQQNSGEHQAYRAWRSPKLAEKLNEGRFPIRPFGTAASEIAASRHTS